MISVKGGNRHDRERNKSLQAKEKKEVTTPAELTKPGLVFNPAVDIFENRARAHSAADLPGVKTKDLKIDLKDNVLTLTADETPLEGPQEKDVLREYRSGTYYRQFSLPTPLISPK